MFRFDECVITSVPSYSREKFPVQFPDCAFDRRRLHEHSAAAEQEEARQYEALVFAKSCEEHDKIEDDLRREMERTAGKYFDHAAASGA